MPRKNAAVVLEDGTVFFGYSFGSEKNSSGEVVFNTGMVGYPETLTDPSYHGQILTFTYPLIGNYGVPSLDEVENGLKKFFESDKIHLSGIIVSEYCREPSHWNSEMTLSGWLKQEGVPAACGIDTRALTKKIREKGVMLGKIIIAEDIENMDIESNHERIMDFFNPDTEEAVPEVAVKEPKVYSVENKKATIMLIDCGCKNNIIRSFLKRGVEVVRVPWDYDIFSDEFSYDALFVSNGPGNPKMYDATIENVRKAIEKELVVLGICLGNQIIALASGMDTYKMKYGHRSHNQPCIDVESSRCYITSQNHGFAVDENRLGLGWKPWFVNANDGTIEGIKHKEKPFMSVQFHPEAMSGPVDTEFLFDKFVEVILEDGKRD